MNTKILNRDFQHPTDGWYQIEAKGNHPNRAAGVVQVIDDEACQAIVNRFNADAGAGKLSHGHEMLIDHEHFKHDSDKETTAYGWLIKLENRADGYYGQVRWTNTGKPAVDGGDYRFFSTEYDPADLRVLNTKGKAKSVRPLRLDGLTLTNDPNNKGGRPITNQGLAKVPADGNCPDCECALQSTDDTGIQQCPQCHTHFADATAPAANQPKTNQAKMKNVAIKLGLAAEASEDAVLEAVTKIQNRLTAADTEVVKLTNRLTPLETENQVLLGEQVDAILAEHGVKDAKVINRLKPILTPLKNRQERLDTLADLGIKAGEAKPAAGHARVLNRGGGNPPAVKTGDDAGADQRRATKVMNRAKSLMTETPNLSLATAVSMADQEVE